MLPVVVATPHDELVLLPDQAAGELEPDVLEGRPEGHAVTGFGMGHIDGPAVHQDVVGTVHEVVQEL